MRMILVVCLLVGCERLDATGQPMKPIAAEKLAPAPSPSPSLSDVPEPAPVFEEDDPDAAKDPVVDEVPLDPIALLALQQGIELENVPDLEPPAEPGLEPALVVAADSELDSPVYAWDPETAPPSTWGIRLLSTVNSTLPPRAVIGLPDGSEQVVQPGAMLAEQRVIVLAIGVDVIQIAQVIPDGVQARIETQTVTSLFPK